MTELSKEKLEAIVNEFGHLADKPYNEEYAWCRDVSNNTSPIELAEWCDNCGDNHRAFLQNIVDVAEESALDLQIYIEERNAQAWDGDQIERDCSLLVDDILKNIAEEAKEALES